jgi:hypothetical protein
MNNVLERLAEKVDAVIAVHARLATDAAIQAVAIDEARLISESLPGDSSFDREHVARRVLVTELACALCLPERTMETLIEVSKTAGESPRILAVPCSGSRQRATATTPSRPSGSGLPPRQPRSNLRLQRQGRGRQGPGRRPGSAEGGGRQAVGRQAVAGSAEGGGPAVQRAVGREDVVNTSNRPPPVW